MEIKLFPCNYLLYIQIFNIINIFIYSFTTSPEEILLSILRIDMNFSKLSSNINK